MSEPTQSRRRFLAGVTGTAVSIGLAGCNTLAQSGDGSSDDEDGHQDGEDGHDDEEDGHNEEDGHHEEESHDDGEDGHQEEGGHDEGEEGHNDEESHDDGHGHNHDEGTLEEPSSTAEVLLQTEGGQHHFAPHAVWIEPGGTVTWKLESGQHDVVAYHPDNDKPLRMPDEAESWSTEILSEEGATVSHTFETEGVYDYFCTPHESVGMVGTVIVGKPDAHGQPALEEPQSSLPDGARSELADLGEQANEALGHTH